MVLIDELIEKLNAQFAGEDFRDDQVTSWTRALVEANKVKPLLLLGAKPDSIFPNVPLYESAAGRKWNAGAWRGIAGPKGLPRDVGDKLAAALKKIYDGKTYQDFLAARGFGALYAPPAEFATFMQQSDDELGAAMKAVGIAK